MGWVGATPRAHSKSKDMWDNDARRNLGAATADVPAEGDKVTVGVPLPTARTAQRSQGSTLLGDENGAAV